jgi:branched-chain amino acid transport system ATP-binding protein
MTPLVTIENLTVNFDGLTAVDGVNMTVRQGEICGLIGPNGAGKTTLFNAISGLVTTSTGRIVLAGEDITSSSAPMRASQGIRRTFQSVQLVQSLTVYENLLFGLHTATRNLLTSFIVGHRMDRGPEIDVQATIDHVLSYLGLSDLGNCVVDTLTIAQQRYVEIGQALVAKPKILMLDEPTAGLSPAQIERLDALIEKLPADWKLSIVLVEHFIPLVMKLCSRITVLDRGRVIAEGSGVEIQSNPAVHEAYLGERLHA